MSGVNERKGGGGRPGLRQRHALETRSAIVEAARDEQSQIKRVLEEASSRKSARAPHGPPQAGLKGGRGRLSRALMPLAGVVL